MGVRGGSRRRRWVRARRSRCEHRRRRGIDDETVDVVVDDDAALARIADGPWIVVGGVVVVEVPDAGRNLVRRELDGTCSPGVEVESWR